MAETAQALHLIPLLSPKGRLWKKVKFINFIRLNFSHIILTIYSTSTIEILPVQHNINNNSGGPQKDILL
ncbi:hypothetical protein DCCM_0939 [Desulfocucumis palustris]|uniref:Uncharacterized protein n=1 Tax=Desulfocucumis palustris TaxID=1898651 RepID=A0A2L2XAQ9_9FIRM|nr:hypothetical protein DCCM_0939 [Desulfocucumis palustris]